MQKAKRLSSALAWLSGRGERLPARLVVLSTHLDDGIFSLGAGIAAAARAGASVRVLTVLAGDPDSTAPAGKWDAVAGFRSAGEAARLRRDEDRRACARVGAEPRWLPFSDHQYPRGAGDDEIAAALVRELDGAETLLVPGFPLQHEDHVWLAQLVERLDLPVRVGRYVEQPYAIWSGPPPAGSWRTVAADARDRVAKTRACRAYATQLATFHFRPELAISRFEAARGGEMVAW